MSISDDELTDALLRENLLAFVMRVFPIYADGETWIENWHHDVVTDLLEQCERGEIRRLLINLPPRTAKSFIGVIALTCWLIGRAPNRKILIICYGDDLATKHVRHIRDIIRSKRFRKLFPGVAIRQDKSGASHFETTKGGMVRASSVQGQIAGFGADFILIDDPMKIQDAASEVERRKLEEAYGTTISTRLNDPAKGVIITIMQRLHLDDFSAFLETLPGWHKLSIPAIAGEDRVFTTSGGGKHSVKLGQLMEPKRLSQVFLDERRSQNAQQFEALYQQNPGVSADNFIKPQWFKRFTKPPETGFTVISIDPAFSKDKGDYSAALVCRLVDRDVYVVHAERHQYEFPYVCQWIRHMDKRWSPDLIVVEALGSGLGLYQQLRNDGLRHVESVGVERFSKTERLEMVTPQIEAGHVWLPEQGDFLGPLINELIAFPNGAHDDWVDTLSQLLGYLENIRVRANWVRRERNPEPEVEPLVRPYSQFYGQLLV